MLIIWGMKDRFFPPENFLSPWKLSFPNARIREIDSAGHFVHEEEPELVSAEIKNLIGSIK